MESATFIELKQLSFAYITPSGSWHRFLGSKESSHSVLRQVNLKLSVGDQVVIYGPEGSGKSTLLKLLAGALSPTTGHIQLNGALPHYTADNAAGYISIEENESTKDTVSEMLYAFGQTHALRNLPARIGEITELLKLTPVLDRQSKSLSLNQRLRLNLARAALSEASVILGDDLPDYFGPEETRYLLATVLKGRTVIITTRHAASAEALGLPLLLLHNARLIGPATRPELAEHFACPLHLDAWIEGINYDLIRQLKATPGFEISDLQTDHKVGGQRLRLRLPSTHYLPTAYDVLSQATLVKTEEHPASLAEIINRLH